MAAKKTLAWGGKNRKLTSISPAAYATKLAALWGNGGSSYPTDVVIEDIASLNPLTAAIVAAYMFHYLYDETDTSAATRFLTKLESARRSK